MSENAPRLIKALLPITTRVRTDVTAIKLPEGSRWTDEPLTEARLLKHLNGGPARGCCPISPGSRYTLIAALDFDSHKGETPWPEMCRVAKMVSEGLDLVGLPSVAFRSSGGKGIHLYIIWDQPQDTYSVRRGLDELLGALGYKNGAGGVSKGEIEIFPKQDEVKEGKYGNQFILPLAGHSAPLDAEFRVLSKEEAPLEWPVAAPMAVLTKPERSLSTSTPAELKVLASALDAIPNSGDDELSYDDWRNIIFAIHHATDGSDEGLALAHEFSCRSSKYSPEFLEERCWQYIDSNRDGVITERTILARARQHGWTEDVSDDFDVLDDEGEPATADVAIKHRFAPIPAAVFATLAQTEWHIKMVLPKADIIVLYGPPGSGKSFLALDMAMSIARGVEWRGHKSQQGVVVYVCAEGSGGFRKRLIAFSKHHGIPLEDLQLLVIPAAPNMLRQVDVEALYQQLITLGPISLCVMDTFAQVTAGGNENSGEDMGKALGHCKYIAHKIGCTVLLVHHSGKDEARGARGWSGIRAAVDAEIEVVRDKDERGWQITKQKDGDDDLSGRFALATVTLGEDADGDPITSCVIEHCEGGAASVKAKKNLGALEIVLLQALENIVSLTNEAPKTEELIDVACEMRGIPDSGKAKRNQRSNISRSISALCTREVLKIEDGKVIKL